MLSAQASPRRLTELNWLAEVQEFAPPLAPDAPIWMREVEINEDLTALRAERHPCCEIGLMLQGEGTALIQGAEARFAPGNLLLLGPGVPHSLRIEILPQR